MPQIDWVPSSIIATIIGTMILFVVFISLYRQEHNRALLLWAGGWGFCFLRYLCHYFSVTGWAHPAVFFAIHVFGIACSGMLVAGTYRFLEKKMPLAWLALFGAAALASAACAFYGWNLWADGHISMPVFMLLAVIDFGIAISFLRGRALDLVGRCAIGLGFVLWGGFRVAFPFIHGDGSLIPYSYISVLLCEFLVAGGMLLLHIAKFKFSMLAARQDLALKEERLRLAMEATSEGIWDWDISQDRMCCSPRALTLMELNQDSPPLRLEEWLKCVLEDDRPMVDAAIRRAVGGTAAGESIQCEFRAPKKDGTFIWLMLRGGVLPSLQSGSSAKLAGTISDISERKRAESRYAFLFGQMLNGLAILELLPGIEDDYRFLSVNPSFEKITGLSSADVLGRLCSELFKGRTRDFWDHMERVCQSGMPRNVVFYSSNLKMHLEMLSYRLEDGKIACVFQDVSSRVEYENALKSSEKNYREIFNSPKDAILVQDAHNGVIMDMNIAAEEMFSYSRTELIGKDFTAVSALGMEFTIEFARERSQETVKNGVATFEWLCRRKGGDSFWCEVKLSRANIGGEQRLLSVMRDITERKRAEEALQQAYIRNNAAFEVVSAAAVSPHISAGEIEKTAAQIAEMAAKCLGVERVGLWLFSDKNSCSNLACIDLYELSLNRHSRAPSFSLPEVAKEYPTLAATRYMESAAPLDDPRLKSLAEAYLIPNRISSKLDANVVVLGRSLGMLCFEHVSKKHAWAQDEISFACHLADLISIAILNSERRSEEEERRKLEDRLRHSEKLDAIGQLAGGVAHDFNNMLTGIIGYAEMIMKNANNPKVARYAEHVLQAAKHSAELTRQLLAFARKGQFQNINVDVNVVVDDVIALLSRTIERNISLVKEIGTVHAMVVGDPTQLNSAILNLCLNARDAMPSGGVIRISTSAVELDNGSRRQLLGEASSGPHVRIDVSDTGCGMGPEVKKRLFEPFFTTKEQGKGTGLGLASVYGTVSNHHGAILVNSEVGKGSVFSVFLPVAEIRNQKPDTRMLAAAAAGNDARVLVVDDEAVLRDVLSDMLRSLGFRVEACANGPVCIDLYREKWQEIDVVILDMVMPAFGVRQTFDAFKKINPEVKVLLSSGYSFNENAQELLDLGVMGFVQKPFEISQLSARLRRALSRKLSDQ